MGYAEDKQAKRAEREMKRIQRAMATPVTRGETYSLGEATANHIMSIAIALEALEQALVDAGVLNENELMERATVLAQAKRDAAQVAISQEGQVEQKEN